MQVAKPGLGRVYVLHGEYGNLSRLYPGGPAPVAMPGGAGASFLGNFLLGAVAGAISKSDPDKPPKLSENWIAGDYKLNNLPLATLSKGQYVALDLAPGAYLLEFTHGEALFHLQGSRYLTVEADTVTYLKSMTDIHRNGRTGFFDCGDDCPERIHNGQRVAVEWPSAGTRQTP